MEGDSQMTRSRLTIEGQDFECEVTEPAFADYEKSFHLCSYMCLPRGTYRCKVKATQYGPTSIVVAKCPGHVNAVFGWEPLDDVMVNTLLVDSRKSLERLNEMGRRALILGEGITIEVRNELKDFQ